MWRGRERLKPLVDSRDLNALNSEIRERIFDVGTLFRDKVVEWDVVNEPVNNHALQDVLGREAMAQWFRWAREADPEARLYLNDYTMLSGGATDPARIDAFYDNVKFLIDQGAPIHGIGEQAHFGWTLVGPERMLKILDRFASFGLPIQITEFDVAVTDEQLQADYLRDFYTAAFSHPAVNSIVMWGFWENKHWMPDAALWRKDWSIKPNGQNYRDLVYGQWWTDTTETTNAAGEVRLRGFKGDHQVRVERDGRSATVKVRLAEDARVDVAIE